MAFSAIGSGNKELGDNSFWLRKCRELCLRPAVEPLLLARWKKLKSFAMSEGQLADLCSLMSGAKQQARRRNSHGLWDGGNVSFEPPEQAKNWWADIQTVANRPELTPLLPAYCFARTIIAHPYPDGNGRLARALVHASLARMTQYTTPSLPLAPAFYMNGAKVAHALRHLSDSGDWSQFNEMFWQVLEMARELAHGL